MPRRQGRKPRRPRQPRVRNKPAPVRKQRRKKVAVPVLPPPTTLRPASNTTCDIYHAGSTPPTPDVSAVFFHLAARFQQGSESSEGDQSLRWTHLGFFDTDVDLRDNYPAAPNSTLVVPTTGGTTFDIVFIELVNRGSPNAYKRVFLNRQTPDWPTEQL